MPRGPRFLPPAEAPAPMEPVCLVERVPTSGMLRVNPSALRQLRMLAQPLHVLAVFGPRRTGKSFLLDQLAGAAAGSGPQRGIWMRCLSHPTRAQHSLVLLDTEGFPDHEQDDKDAFSRLFVLNVLLSSVFVYNSCGDGDPQAQLERLTYVRELPRRVRVLPECCEPWDSGVLLSTVLPAFVWCLRDVAPDPQLDWELEEEQHNLDSTVSAAPGADHSLTRCIQSTFSCRKLFRFCPPGLDGEWGTLPAPLGPLHPTFQRQLEHFQQYVLSCEPKGTLGKHLVDGTFLAGMLERIVELLGRDEAILLQEVCKELLEATIPHEVEGCRTPSPSGPVLESRGAASATQLLRPDPKVEAVVILQASAASDRGGTGGASAQVSLWDPAQATSATGPICLVENVPSHGLKVNREALVQLQARSQPVVVVAIAGLYRTGKSYLMNRLAGKKTGFSLGSTIQSHTKGIWMWCVPHPRRPSHTLVLLDTEGLGDVEKGNTKNDTWIFTLAVLLSSTLVYNSLGIIDQGAMDRLHYVTELTEHIQAKAAPGASPAAEEDGAQFVRFFPAFVWAVRDFTLQLRLDGRDITADEYLEHTLRLKPGSGRVAQTYNLPRQCLRHFFPTRKCFVFEQPARGQDLHRLEELHDNQLNLGFREQAARFCAHIWATAQAKALPGGHVVTGKMLGDLVVTYVDAIRSGVVPCLESAVLALAQVENSAAVEAAMARYSAALGPELALPTETLLELLALHAQAEREALRTFMARAFKDDTRQFQTELMRRLEQQKEELCQRNERASLERCQAVLAEVSRDLDACIRDGFYAVPGGYQRFLGDRQEMVERYQQVPGKGIKANATLQDFLASREPMAQAILRVDRALMETEKEVEAQRTRAEAAEREQELLQQEQAELQQKLEEQRRSHEEHVRQLEETLQREQKALLEELDRTVAQKLQEQEALLREGFRKESARVGEELRRLREESSAISQPSWISAALTLLGDVASLVLPCFMGKVVGLGTRLLGRFL
ncbi:PREDICTED: guanylate-binding protein 1-like isoform X2 [Crocodylus porosus]|uniref:guanylate-binding protein 1-like isoform X2 n=1 Tax=Crocodylus porosus TaxID=8502 RepID=UPI000938AB4A|nr:PREDICTED: guanylate-binding protein 1-like isoform X2 [Crocodylus porosus]